MKLRSAAVALALLGVVAALFVPGCERLRTLVRGDRCVLNNRPIMAQTAVSVAVQGGPEGRACCLRCAITYSIQNRKHVRVLWVSDYPTHRPIPAGRAWYVTGSDVAPCVQAAMQTGAGRRECILGRWDRCSPSSIAFLRESDARRFQGRHGGAIQSFAQVIAGADVSAAAAAR